MDDEREHDAEQQVVQDPVDPVEHPEPVPATHLYLKRFPYLKGKGLAKVVYLYFPL